eukprot:10950988-Ditylum_brightwellii.AAC.1
MSSTFQNYPQFSGRCFLFKGPSRPFWFCDNKIFEEVAKDAIDPKTKKAFRPDALKLKGSAEHNWPYHLLYSPKIPKDHASDPFKTKMNGFALIWTIGEAGGHCTNDADDDANIDLISLF